MTSTKEDLQNVGAGEGIVFGSILITVDGPTRMQPGFNAFLEGQKAGDATYALIISASGMNPAKMRYTVSITPEQEFTFIRKLPAGEYQIEKIAKQGFTNLEMNVGAGFRVTSAQTSYVGKLVIRLPDRIRPGTPIRVGVEDAQAETTGRLKGEHAEALARPTRSLIFLLPPRRI
jgi:hypothetical protein